MELLLILMVGLLVFGPDSLPDAMRAGYRWYLQLSRWVWDLKNDIEREVRSDEIIESFKKDKEQLAALDDSIRSNHLDLLDSFEKGKSNDDQVTGARAELPAGEVPRGSGAH